MAMTSIIGNKSFKVSPSRKVGIIESIHHQLVDKNEEWKSPKLSLSNNDVNVYLAQYEFKFNDKNVTNIALHIEPSDSNGSRIIWTPFPDEFEHPESDEIEEGKNHFSNVYKESDWGSDYDELVDLVNNMFRIDDLKINYMVESLYCHGKHRMTLSDDVVRTNDGIYMLFAGKGYRKMVVRSSTKNKTKDDGSSTFSKYEFMIPEGICVLDGSNFKRDYKLTLPMMNNIIFKTMDEYLIDNNDEYSKLDDDEDKQYWLVDNYEECLSTIDTMYPEVETKSGKKSTVKRDNFKNKYMSWSERMYVYTMGSV